MAAFDCPYCYNRSKIDDVVIQNCLAYGSKSYKLACGVCHGAVHVAIERRVYVDLVTPGSFTEDDWGTKAIPEKELRRKILITEGDARHRARISDQKDWIRQCGGTLEGYVANYGSINDPDHYGDGGEAIYAADMAELARLQIRTM